MKTRRASWFSLPVVLCVPASITVLAAACGGNQGDSILSPDGSVIEGQGSGTGSSSGSGSGVVIVPGSGSGSSPTTFDAGNPGTGTGSGTGTTGSGTGTGGVCPSSCTSDSQCQSACPSSPGALNCCDTVTSACFTSASSVCPDQMTTSTPDSGGTGY